MSSSQNDGVNDESEQGDQDCASSSAKINVHKEERKGFHGEGLEKLEGEGLLSSSLKLKRGR